MLQHLLSLSHHGLGCHWRHAFHLACAHVHEPRGRHVSRGHHGFTCHWRHAFHLACTRVREPRRSP